MVERYIHNLKTLQEYYLEVVLRKKQFELRKDDRTPPFEVGDYLNLMETRAVVEDGGVFTENSEIVVISYILRSKNIPAEFGLKDGYCIMGIEYLLPQTVNIIQKKAFPWDDKLSILFTSDACVSLVKELTRSWTDLDWKLLSTDANLTPNQYHIDLIRKAQKFISEESHDGVSLLEKAFLFEQYLEDN